MFAERVLKKLEKFGEEFVVDGNTYHGVFRLLDSSTMHTYLDDVEIMGVEKPALLLATEPDADIEIDDTITRDGRTYTVWKTSLHRIGEVAVVMIVILS